MLSLIENFGHYSFKFLEASTATVQRVSNDKQINEVIARNLASLMSAPSSQWRNPNAIASRAKVSPSSIHNLLDPGKRTTTAGKPVGSPRVDLLQRVAAVFNRQAWELLHPDLATIDRQRAVYDAAQQALHHEEADKAATVRAHVTPRERAPLSPSVHEPAARYQPKKKRAERA
jgi:hypothetical protein